MDPNARPKQLNSSAVSTIVKWGSRANTRLYQATGGRLGGTWRVGAAMRKPVEVCLLTTVGRKSGLSRTVPLLYLVDGDDIVVVASQAGMTNHPAWYLNVRENPEVSVQIGRATQEMVARTAEEAERERLWPRLVELYADFDTYAAWTERKIPVVICSPR